jgi:hypothetical protein
MAPRTLRTTSSTADNTPSGSNPPAEQRTEQEIGGMILAERLEAAQRRIAELEEEQERRRELETLEERIRQLQGTTNATTEHQREAIAAPSLYPVRRAPKTRELPTYKGKTIKEHQNFFYQAELKWREDRDLTWVTDADKVTHCVSSFEGTARDVWKRKERQEGVDNTSWEDFVEFMKNAIADPGNRNIQSVLAYERAAQRDNQSVQSFVSYLDSLEDDLGYTGTAQSRNHLLAKLRKEIQEEINRQGNPPTDREELISLATRIENHQGFYGEKPSGRGDSGGHKRKREGGDDGRDGKNSYGGRNRSRSPRRDAGQRRPDIAATGVNIIPTTGAKGREDVICFKCKKSGHYATACPMQVTCYNCGRAGHKSFACPEPRKQPGNDKAPQ